MQDQTLATPYRLTTTDFHRMGEIGIFAEDARIELIEGELIEMAPIGSRHAGIVMQLVRLLTMAVGDRAMVSPQNPLLLEPHSEPEPDVALLRPRADFYKNTLPRPRDVLLLIEVADSTLRYDRDIKIPLYARHGIPEVWLMDLARDAVECHRQPTPTGYGTVQTVMPPEQVTSPGLPGVRIALADLLA